MQLNAFEIKWNAKAKARFPQSFTANYPGTPTFVVTPGNVEDFLLTIE